jgi:glutathione-regulated potassium-efflux system ancillary protein KefF
MAKNLIIHAHPQPDRSLTTASLLAVLSQESDTEVRSLYGLYPDFDIDVAAEQRALEQAERVVWLSPIYWYTVPGLLKHWFDMVLSHGWAYGSGGHALHGKAAWWVTSAGAAQKEYAAGGMHGRSLHEFLPVVEHVARYCGMQWAPPFVVHAGHHASAAERADYEARLRAQWQALAQGKEGAGA